MTGSLPVVCAVCGRRKYTEIDCTPCRQALNWPINFEKVTRVTVVREGGGHLFEGWDLYTRGAEVVIQDEGRTLKILPRREP